MKNLTKLKLQHKFSRNTNKVVETIISWIVVLERHLEKLDARQDAATAALILEIESINSKEKNAQDVLTSKREELDRQVTATKRKANSAKRDAEKIVNEIKESNEADRKIAANLLGKISTLVE